MSPNLLASGMQAAAASPAMRRIVIFFNYFKAFNSRFLQGLAVLLSRCTVTVLAAMREFGRSHSFTDSLLVSTIKLTDSMLTRCYWAIIRISAH